MTDDQPSPPPRLPLQLNDLTELGLARLEQLLTVIANNDSAQLDRRRIRRQLAERELRRFLADWPRRTA